MLAAFLTTIFFSLSAIFATRSTRLIGATEANFWRMACATVCLSVWAFAFGQGLDGEAFPVLFVSGVVGIGIGDMALFQTLPRLGSRLSLLITQCLTAPFGAAIEWFWLHTHLTTGQMLSGATILIGIAISLAPGRHLNLSRKMVIPGVLFGVLSAFGQASGAVLSRKALTQLHQDGVVIDGGTAAFQRLTGGLLFGAIALLIIKWRAVKGHISRSEETPTMPSKEKWRRVWPWVVANSFAGQVFGGSCYQWAFQTAPTGIVLPIVATTPLVAIPFTLWLEGERVTMQSLVGGAIAVGGVAALTLQG
jgi:drug/metabolite transporter (DMT)-like permease